MSILDEVLVVYSEEQMYDLYQSFKNEGRVVEANKLRAAYINKRIVQDQQINPSDILIRMVKEETDFLDVQYISREDVGSELKEEASCIGAFFLSYLMKRNLVDTHFQYLANTLTREIIINEINPFGEAVVRAFLNIYNGMDVQLYRIKLSRIIQDEIPSMQGLGNALTFKSDIRKYANHFDDYFVSVANNPEATVEEKYVAQLAGSLLAIVYWERKEMIDAKLYVLKTLSITNETDSLYKVLSFIAKEMPAEI